MERQKHARTLRIAKSAALAASILAVTALSIGGPQNSASAASKKEAKTGDFSIAYKNSDKAVKGGDLKIGYETDSPAKMQWLPALSNDAIFDAMASPANSIVGMNAIFWQDKSFAIIKGGPADISFNEAEKSATVTLRKNLKWSDGSDVTAKDYEFSYEMIANPAYGSDRYSSSLTNIVGLEEFREGKADTITGITYPDGENGKTIKIQFKENKPGFSQSGNGYFLEAVTPYNYLKDVAPKDVAASPKTTTKPLVIGAFKPEKIVNGESIKYVPNKYYWGAKPKLNSITYETVSVAKAAAAVSAHKYDIVKGTASSQFKQMKKASGYEILGQQQLYFSLMYYNLGRYDKATSLNVQDRETPLQEQAVRQALGYARNVAQVSKKFSNGLATPANSTVPPIFKQFTSSSVKGYEKQDLEKAKKLLDKAGWKMNKSTGIREKDGKTLSLVYAARQSDANAETVTQNYIQQWKKIGAEVKIYNGKLMDFNAWSEKIMTPPGSSDWDITDGAWSVASEPSQQDLFSAAAPYNAGHFSDETITKDLNDIDSDKSEDLAYRKKAFIKYQKDMNEKAFVIPTNFRIGFTPVNKRVINYTLDYGENELWAKLAVSSNSLATK